MRKGQSVIRFLSPFLTGLNVSTLNIAQIPYAPLLDGRARLRAVDYEAADKARELRTELGLPFWDGALLSLQKLPSVPRGILQGAGFHQVITPSLREYPVEWLNAPNIRTLFGEAASRHSLVAVSSRVCTKDGKMLHIPMMDFHIAYSRRSTSVIKEVLSSLRAEGFLFASGKSYHFYGSSLFDVDELRRFLGRCLLYSPVVDRNWIAHQLIEGSCALRISPRAEYGGAPTLVCIV